MLRELFDTDQERKGQAAEEDDPVSAVGGHRAQEAQVDEQRQDPIQNEMSQLIGKGNVVDEGNEPKIARVCQDDDQNNEQCEKDREPLHTKKSGRVIDPPWLFIA